MFFPFSTNREREPVRRMCEYVNTNSMPEGTGVLFRVGHHMNFTLSFSGAQHINARVDSLRNVKREDNGEEPDRSPVFPRVFTYKDSQTWSVTHIHISHGDHGNCCRCSNIFHMASQTVEVGQNRRTTCRCWAFRKVQERTFTA